MPKKFPEEFQRDAVAVARRAGVTRAKVAADFGIYESTLKRWLAQADVDHGIKDVLTTAEQNQLVHLRWRMRRLGMENEILRGATAYFAAETLPK